MMSAMSSSSCSFMPTHTHSHAHTVLSVHCVSYSTFCTFLTLVMHISEYFSVLYMYNTMCNKERRVRHTAECCCQYSLYSNVQRAQKRRRRETNATGCEEKVRRGEAMRWRSNYWMDGMEWNGKERAGEARDERKREAMRCEAHSHSPRLAMGGTARRGALLKWSASSLHCIRIVSEPSHPGVQHKYKYIRSRVE